MRNGILVSLLVLALAACGSEPVQDPPPVAEPPQTPVSTSGTFHADLTGHFSDRIEGRKAEYSLRGDAEGTVLTVRLFLEGDNAFDVPAESIELVATVPVGQATLSGTFPLVPWSDSATGSRYLTFRDSIQVEVPIVSGSVSLVAEQPDRVRGRFSFSGPARASLLFGGGAITTGDDRVHGEGEFEAVPSRF